MTDNKMDCDESVVNDGNLIFNIIPCKVEIDVIDITSDTEDSVSAVSPNVSLTVGADSGISTKPPLIFNEKYFKIIKKIEDTKHQRAATGVIASCQLCSQAKTIKGSLKITSNFIQHLKSKHNLQYQEYVEEKKREAKKRNSIEVDKKKRPSDVDLNGTILRMEQDPLTQTENPFFADSKHLTLQTNAAGSGVSASMPLIFNGKYFKITTKISDMDNQRAAKCIIADCQLCFKPTTVSGSFKSPSKFVEHLKRQHRLDYDTYLIEKITSENWSNEENTPAFSASYNLKMSPESLLAKYGQHSVGLTEANCDMSMRKALIFNDKYFRIIRKVGYTAHERAANGIIAVCQICKPNKKIKGSLKITSNFVQHLRRKHPQRYETYLYEKTFYDKCSLNQQHQHSDNGSSSLNKNKSSRFILPTNADLNTLKNMPIILNGEFFRIIKKLDHTAHQRKTRGIIADCQLCTPHRRLKGSMLIRSNFVEHLKRKHPAHYKLYIDKNNAKDKCRTGEAEEFIDKVSASVSALSSLSNDSESILPNVHADPDESEIGKEQYTQSDFNDKLLAFLGDSFLPLSVVENPSFRNLFGVNSSEWCRRTYVAHQMQTKYTHLKANIKERLQNVPYVCTTADIWSSRKRFYFGYTCHWIDSNLKRQSAALACRNLEGNHQLGQITDLIHSLNTDFGLDREKVVCTITGNGSNFLKPFKECGIKDNYEINEDDSFDEDSNDVIDFVSDQPHFSTRIPKHYKCGSQNLIEFATIDFTNVLKANSTIYKMHQTSLHRCSSIWDKCNRPETVEITKNLLGRTLKTPNSMCWNSLFDSLKHLILCKTKLDDICSALGVPRFNATEVRYIEEFCLLMEPISLALEFLQNEKDIFYGYFLPILVSTKVKLRKLYECGDLSYLRGIAKQMEMALVEKFRNFFEISPDCYDAVISAIACPSIKMRFSKPLRETTMNASLEDLKLIFIRHAKEFQDEVEFVAMPARMEAASLNTYFDFDETTEEIVNQHNKTFLLDVRGELERYLEDGDCTMECLHRYPIIKKTFMKYNTPLPSSSPVERLFSFEGIANRQRRQNLSDEHFERTIIMGANKIFDFN